MLLILGLFLSADQNFYDQDRKPASRLELSIEQSVPSDGRNVTVRLLFCNKGPDYIAMSQNVVIGAHLSVEFRTPAGLVVRHNRDRLIAFKDGRPGKPTPIILFDGRVYGIVCDFNVDQRAQGLQVRATYEYPTPIPIEDMPGTGMHRSVIPFSGRLVTGWVDVK